MQFDFDLLVIGAGSGGVRAARFAADYGARVAIVENRYLGGTCVNVGCVPKKILAYGADLGQEFELARDFGWTLQSVELDWEALKTRRAQEIQRLNGVYEKLLQTAGVTIIHGQAKLSGEHTVDVNSKSYSAKHILIATGSWPNTAPEPFTRYAITSNEIFDLPALPKRLMVVGGGYIAVEFASIFHGLGVSTTLLCRKNQILREFDSSLAQHLQEEMQRKGVDIRFNAELAEVSHQDNGSLHATLQDGSVIEADSLLFAIGRRPMLDELGLAAQGVHLQKSGHISVDENYRTNVPSIYALGDVIGRVQLTPVALAEGMALAKQLFCPQEYKAVDYDFIPTCVFSLPNAASVGLSEQAAKEKDHHVKIFESKFKDLKQSLRKHNHAANKDSEEKTFIKLVVDAQSDRVLGCHMVGAHAGEIIQGLAIALKAGASKQLFDETIGVHPSIAEEFVSLRKSVR